MEFNVILRFKKRYRKENQGQILEIKLFHEIQT